ncbi:hypothetical protein IRJ41_025192, partial [Triplophysa rosa]
PVLTFEPMCSVYEPRGHDPMPSLLTPECLTAFSQKVKQFAPASSDLSPHLAWVRTKNTKHNGICRLWTENGVCCVSQDGMRSVMCVRQLRSPWRLCHRVGTHVIPHTSVSQHRLASGFSCPSGDP